MGRPRQVRRILALMWFGAPVFVALMVALPKSDAGGPVNAARGSAWIGRWVLRATRPDGAWYHCRNGVRPGLRRRQAQCRPVRYRLITWMGARMTAADKRACLLLAAPFIVDRLPTGGG